MVFAHALIATDASNFLATLAQVLGHVRVQETTRRHLQKHVLGMLLHVTGVITDIVTALYSVRAFGLGV